MREFGTPINDQTYAAISALARSVFERAEPKQEVRASEFAMEEEPDQVVVDRVDLKHDGERLRIAVTRLDARPPFEWLLEISSDIGEADYFKHYLIRENDIVLAQRKVLTVIDDEEAQLIMTDLRTAEGWLID